MAGTAGIYRARLRAYRRHWRARERLRAPSRSCAARDTNIAAEREYRAREAKARAEEELLTGLPLLPALLDECRTLSRRVMATQSVMVQFRGRGAAFQRALRLAIKGSGLLTVTEILGARAAGGPSGMRTAGSTVETRDVQFGMLAGPAAVASTCHVVEDLEATLALLSLYPPIAGDDMILDYLAGMEDAALLASAKALADARRGLAAIYARLDDIAAFFTTANAARITRWGSHADAPVRMRANCRMARCATQVEFEIIGGQGRRLGLLIPSEFWPHGQRPASL